jgi:hypothetical protein
MLRFTSLIFGLGILGCFGFANGLAGRGTQNNVLLSSKLTVLGSDAHFNIHALLQLNKPSLK